MKSQRFITVLIIFVLNTIIINAQGGQIVPDLSSINKPDKWTVFNRKTKYEKDDKVVYLNSEQGSGFVRINDFIFKNGTIEVDLKGKDEFQRSFLGIAFHGIDDSTYDAVYFRPFNFKNPERSGHSVQYVAEPKNTWNVLRQEHPDEYENQVNPVPYPTEWFHVIILVEYPSVKVFVNNSTAPSLEVDQLSNQKKGWVGLWVGNGSDGSFRNFTIIPGND